MKTNIGLKFVDLVIEWIIKKKQKRKKKWKSLRKKNKEHEGFVYLHYILPKYSVSC